MYVAELKTKLELGCKLIYAEIIKILLCISTEQQSKLELVVGQKVLFLLPSSNNKLQIWWRGAFEVLEKVSRTNYKISIKGKQIIYHVILSKKYHGRHSTEPVHLKALATDVETEPNIMIEFPLQCREVFKNDITSYTLC